ncbi:MAG: hypothetical protein ABSF61_07825 [Anaerolineales bacterium]|jgi:hypothetical protein
MPVEEGIGAEDEERLLPTVDPAGEEDEPAAIQLGEAWFLDLTVEEDQLPAEEGILRDEFGFGAGEIDRFRENERKTRGLGEVEENLLHEGNCGVDESDRWDDKGRHAD